MSFFPDIPFSFRQYCLRLSLKPSAYDFNPIVSIILKRSSTNFFSIHLLRDCRFKKNGLSLEQFKFYLLDNHTADSLPKKKRISPSFRDSRGNSFFFPLRSRPLDAVLTDSFQVIDPPPNLKYITMGQTLSSCTSGAQAALRRKDKSAAPGTTTYYN